MKAPLSWLREFIETSLSPEAISERLTLLGLEVESCEKEVLHIGLTPNLNHCANLFGIARELHGTTQEPLHRPAPHVEELGAPPRLSVHVEEEESCPRYSCRLVRSVKVGPSPAWLRERLEAAGMKSINNVVDISNYVMLAYGQPLHAFDAGKIRGGKLVVRFAREGEQLILLDGTLCTPSRETLLICDAERPLALAGIMGGIESGITGETTEVLLESATFAAHRIRRTSKQLGLLTEASRRFERRTDPNGVRFSLDAATQMLVELAGGEASPCIDLSFASFPPKRLSCRLERVHQLLGLSLSEGEVEEIFHRLQFVVCDREEGAVTVEVPTYRQDISSEIDLIEEIARLYGYENIPQRPPLYRASSLPHAPCFVAAREVRTLLLREGLQEFLCCDLISAKAASLISEKGVLELVNPISPDHAVLRPSLLPGLLDVARHNQDHGTHSLAGFEIGRVHVKTKEGYEEPTLVSLLWMGSRDPLHWSSRGQEVDFYDMKGLVESLFAGLELEPHFLASRHRHLHPGRQVAIHLGERAVGMLGEIHPSFARHFDLNLRCFFAEISLEGLQQERAHRRYVPLPLFPGSFRDWTVTLEEGVPVGNIVAQIHQKGSPLLKELLVLDVYRSEKLGSGLKNVTLRFLYRDRAQTLSLEQVDREHQRLTEGITR